MMYGAHGLHRSLFQTKKLSEPVTKSMWGNLFSNLCETPYCANSNHSTLTTLHLIKLVVMSPEHINIRQLMHVLNWFGKCAYVTLLHITTLQKMLG